MDFKTAPARQFQFTNPGAARGAPVSALYVSLHAVPFAARFGSFRRFVASNDTMRCAMSSASLSK